MGKTYKKERDVENKSYLKEVFEIIEDGLRKSLVHYDKIVFESTALSEYFDLMLSNLKKDYNITTIGIKADSNICLERVLSRDNRIHINISDSQVTYINQKVLERNFQTDYQINNMKINEIDLKIEISLIINKILK